MMKSLIYSLFLILIFGGWSQDAFAQKKKKKIGTKAVKELLTPYEKLFKGKRVLTSKGLMTVHLVNGKVYVEFPVALLGRDVLYATSIEDISDNGEGIVGQFSDDGCVFRFTKMDSVLHARMVVVREPVNDGGDHRVAAMIEKSKMPGIYMTLKIEAYTPDSSAIVVDLTTFFLAHNAYASPFPEMAGNSMFGFVYRDHKFDLINSRLTRVAAYPSTVMVTGELFYKVDYYMLGRPWRRDVPVTVTANKMLTLLPEVPMPIREADSRVGVAFMERSGIKGASRGMAPLFYAKRWRMEPTDTAAYARGERVTPKKQIVVYMDTLIPQAWKRYVKEGIEAWNTAFEKIGFNNAIRVVEFPKHDPDFNANDIARSVIRYSPSWSYNMQNSLLVDPRTGEILNASIYLHNNSISIMQRERILATMGADPAVRCSQFPDELIGRLIRANVMQQMGLNLGLLPNFAASNAYPVDSLRSASFTQKNGISASVMDYMQYNYIAQPEDVEKGVLLEPRAIGPYDDYVIRWLYQPIVGARTPADEVSTLDRWIEEKAGDPVYRYGLRQHPMFAFDPSVLVGDLGNDPILGMEYFKKNLKRYVKNFHGWYAADDRNMSYRALLFGRVGFAYNGKLNNVINYVGGIYMNEVKVGDGLPAFQVVPREKQKEIVKYIIAQAKEIDWLMDADLAKEFEIGTDIRVRRSAILGALLGRVDRLALCVEKDPKAYSPEELVDDVYGEVWKETIAGRALTPEDMMLQQGLLGSIANTSRAGAAPGTFESLQKMVADENPLCMEEIAEKINARLAPENLSAFSAYSEEQNRVEKSGFYPTMTKIEANRYSSAALFYDILLKTRRLIQRAVVNATGETKAHYEFMLYKIDRMLKKE